MEAQLLLALILIILVEYGLKALFENAATRIAGLRPGVMYLSYRITTFACYGILVSLFSSAGPLMALAAGALLTIAASLELPASAFSGWIYVRTGRLGRPLLVLAHGVFAAALLWAGITLPWNQALPARLTHLPTRFFTSDELLRLLRWPLVYAAASVPANYLIRWLMNKEADLSLPELAASDLLPSLAAPPANIHFSVSPAAAEEARSETYKTGRIIGVLERWMLLALFSQGELTAVGLVFTAKSIVRYREFERKDFAEYYLVGTLYSILIAMALSTLL